MASLTAGAVREQRRGLAGWAAAVVVLTLLTLSFWPAYADSAVLDELVADLPEGLRAFVGDFDLATPEGFVASQLFAFLLPLLFAVYAIGSGAAAVAGAEERGSLELLLALPRSRARVALERAAATAAGLGWLTVVFTAALVAGNIAFGLEVASAGLAAAALAQGLLGLALGAVAYAVGAATGSRAGGLATAAAVALFGYVVHTFAGVVEVLDTLRWLSLFTLAFGDDPVADALAPGPTAALVGFTAVVVVIGTVMFTRRDVRG